MFQKIIFERRKFSFLVSFLVISLPLLLGGLIYVSFRSTTLLMFDWFDHLGLSDQITYLRRQVLQYRPNNDIIIYSLPGALWVFSFLGFVWVYPKESRRASMFAILVAFVSIGIEIMQIFSTNLGSFCFNDLFLNLVAILIFLITFVKKKYYEK